MTAEETFARILIEKLDKNFWNIKIDNNKEIKLTYLDSVSLWFGVVIENKQLELRNYHRFVLPSKRRLGLATQAMNSLEKTISEIAKLNRSQIKIVFVNEYQDDTTKFLISLKYIQETREFIINNEINTINTYSKTIP